MKRNGGFQVLHEYPIMMTKQECDQASHIQSPSPLLVLPFLCWGLALLDAETVGQVLLQKAVTIVFV
jgi:hypothetical protein